MEKTTRITKRDNFNTIIGIVKGEVTEFDATALVEFCENEIVLLEKKAASAKAAAAKRKAESDELTEVVLSVLTDEFATITEVTGKIDGPDVTPSKVSYRLNKLVENGQAEKSEVAVPATDGGKARKLVAYRVVTTD